MKLWLSPTPLSQTVVNGPAPESHLEMCFLGLLPVVAVLERQSLRQDACVLNWEVISGSRGPREEGQGYEETKEETAFLTEGLPPKCLLWTSSGDAIERERMECLLELSEEGRVGVFIHWLPFRVFKVLLAL